MLFTHAEHPGRRVRLAYCMNLHPADTLDGVLAAMARITLPLRDRIAPRSASGLPFGVGVYLPAALALELADDARARRRLADFFRRERLDPFTYNAFPSGGFQRPGLKAGVFAPTWKEPERRAFTEAVARVACALPATAGEGHVSISTHTGAFGAWIEGEADLDACADGMLACARTLAALEAETGRRVVLSLEPEPRASAGDTAELARFLERLRARAAAAGEESAVARHLGTCLDTCHAAVELEPADEALARATAAGAPLGKLQFSSALRLPRPDDDELGRERLLALHEPVYLHQVTGRRGDERPRATDLDELARRYAAGEPAWRGCDEWRCHFHVPVDLGGPLDAERMGGLATTRADADRVLALALADPARWGPVDELHVEIETYTWAILPGPVRGAGATIDGLEHEYRHVLALLSSGGWERAA